MRWLLLDSALDDHVVGTYWTKRGATRALGKLRAFIRDNPSAGKNTPAPKLWTLKRRWAK